MEKIYLEAHHAGIIAGNNAKPIPMGVYSADPISGKPIAFIDLVADGVCGFAWIFMKAKTPNNRKFISWAKKANVISKTHDGFWIWVGEFNQSMQRKEAYARAFASVLKANGIDCYADSKMD